MEKKIETRKKIVKVAIWVVAILVLLGTMHVLVNYFDLFEFIQNLHGR